MSGLMMRTFARFVGLAFSILGVWVFVANVSERAYAGGVFVWILAAGALGAIGGVLYLLSFDGPDPLRNRQTRVIGWLGMLILGLVPWSFWFVMLALVLLSIPSLVMAPDEGTSVSPTAPLPAIENLKPSMPDSLAGDCGEDQ